MTDHEIARELGRIAGSGISAGEFMFYLRKIQPSTLKRLMKLVGMPDSRIGEFTSLFPDKPPRKEWKDGF